MRWRAGWLVVQIPQMVVVHNTMSLYPLLLDTPITQLQDFRSNLSESGT